MASVGVGAKVGWYVPAYGHERKKLEAGPRIGRKDGYSSLQDAERAARALGRRTRSGKHPYGRAVLIVNDRYLHELKRGTGGPLWVGEGYSRLGLKRPGWNLNIGLNQPCRTAAPDRNPPIASGSSPVPSGASPVPAGAPGSPTCEKPKAMGGISLDGLDDLHMDEKAAGYYTLKREDAYVRTHPQGLTIGRLTKGQGFQVFGTSAGYAWGYAHGHANKPGWVPMSTLERSKNKGQPVPDFPRAAQHLASNVDYVSGRELDRGKNSRTGVLTADTPLYDNFDGSTPFDRRKMLYEGDAVRVRFRYPGTDYYVVLADGDWGFVPKDRLEFERTPHDDRERAGKG